MKILLLGGAGLMGPAIAKDLIKSNDVEHVTVGDLNKERMDKLEKEANNDKISSKIINVTDKNVLISHMKGFDVCINALPHEFSVPSINACIEAGIDVVDLAFEPEQFDLDDAAKKAKITAIPGCGMDPGITNILVGYGVNQLDRADKVHIIAGGLPEKPYPPLDHKILFRLESLWLEYTHPSVSIRNGEKVVLETLSEIEAVDFPGVGCLECAITPTLASMPQTIKGVKEMICKCPRWPGHYEKIKTFIACGLLGKDPVKMGEFEVVPQKFLSTLLSPVMDLRDGKDVTVIRVMVSGEKDGVDTCIQFDITDWYDGKEKITSVARTTGYPASIIAQMIGRGDIKDKGVLFPEIAISPKLFSEFRKELAERNILIQERVTTTHKF